MGTDNSRNGALAPNKMIRNDKDLIKEVKRYFGRDKRLLKRTVKSIYTNEKDIDYWNKYFGNLCPDKFEVNGRILQETIDAIYAQKFDNIDWNFEEPIGPICYGWYYFVFASVCIFFS